MRIISFNANGIRSAASKGFFQWLEAQDADIVCLQETKSQEHQLGDASFEGWYALSAPAQLAAPAQARLAKELRAVMALPEVQSQFRAQALEPVYRDPAEMLQLMEQEVTQFRAAAARARLTIE